VYNRVHVSVAVTKFHTNLKNIGKWSNFFCTSDAVERIFPEISRVDSFRMSYRACRFGCDRSIITGTVIGKKSTSSALSRLPQKAFFLQLHILHFARMRNKRSKFGCDRLIITGTVLDKRSSSSAVFRLPWEGFS